VSRPAGRQTPADGYGRPMAFPTASDPDVSTPAIDRLLAAARSDLDRVPPEELAEEIADGALVVDLRPLERRTTDGELPGAVVVDRLVLEWRLDPSSPHRLPEADADRRVVLVCNEGYSSSLAAATLRQLGVRRATDLEGGYLALRDAGLVPPG
jgi:rhodanese-related sulfurtransferase